MKENLTFNLINDMKEIDNINGMLEEVCAEFNIDPVQILHLNLVLDELITNIISYGYDDPLEHTITVVFQYSYDDSNLHIIITDDGKPFNPLEYPPADTDSSLEDRVIGNMGIHLVKKLMDHTEYMRKDEKNILHLIKKAE